MTRQRKHQLKLIAQGNCQQCGKPRNLSVCYCDKCLLLVRKRARKRYGSKPWKFGKRGSPPLGVTLR